MKKRVRILKMFFFFVFFCFLTSVRADISNGLVAYYNFNSDDAVSGGTVVDQSGNGHHAIIQGTPASVNGICGKAFDFKKYDYIVSNTNPLAGASAFSVSMWFKTPTPMNNYKLASAAWWYGGANASGWIIGTHYPEAWGDNQTGTFRGEPGWSRTVNFLADQWNHHVVTYDGATVKEYINGQLAEEVPGTGVIIGAGRPMEVGAWSQYSGLNYEGLIDEFRVYDRAISDSEIAALYQQGHEALLVHYDFDSVNNGMVLDKSGKGNHGIIQGTPTLENGVRGKAMNFTQPEYILANANPLAGAQAFTVSLWFKTPTPMNNYKLASAAWWYGGANASGWIVGTHYPEAWGDNQTGTFRGEPGWNRSVSFLADQWNHHVVTYDGATVKEYINGQLAEEVPGTGVIIGAGRPMEVGAWSQYSGLNYEGLIDEFRVYNMALSADQIVSLYEDGLLEQKLLRYVNSLIHPNTGLVASRDGEDFTTVYKNALAAMVFIHQGELVKAEAIFDVFQDYYILHQENFEGFHQSWSPSSGQPDPNSDRWEGDNAFLLLALNYYAQTVGTFENNYQALTQGLIDWLCERAVSGDFIVAEGAANMYGALLPYGQDFTVRDSLNELQARFNGTVDYENVTDHTVRGAAIFNDTTGFQFTDHFSRTETWSYDSTTTINGLAAYANHNYINVEISAQMLLTWKLFQGELDADLSYLEGEIKKLMMPGINDPSSLGLPYTVTEGNPGSFPGSSTQPIIDSSIYFLFYLWDFNPFGPAFHVPGKQPSIEITQHDKITEAGSQAFLNIRWNNLNTEGYKIVAQLENWNVQPEILHLTEIMDFQPNGSRTVEININPNTHTSNACRYVVAVLSKTQGWNDAQCATDTPSHVNLLPAGTPFIEIQSYQQTVEAGDTATIQVRWKNLNPSGYKMVAQLENWNVNPAILHLVEIPDFASEGTQAISIPVASGTNTAGGCRYVVAVLSETQGWGDVQCVHDTPYQVNVIPHLNPTIQMTSYDETVHAGKQAHVQLQWNDLTPEGYKIVVQLENWSVEPAIIYLENITSFSSSGSQDVVIDIPESSNTAGGCRYVAAVLSKTQGWGNVQCSYNTPANVEVLPPLHPTIEILSYDKTVVVGGQAHVQIRWNDLTPEGYDMVVQLENWNVNPPILHMKKITDFSSSGSMDVTISVSSSSNTASNCRYVVAVLSETQEWGDVQCAYDTARDVIVQPALRLVNWTRLFINKYFYKKQ